jgi:hypothetical protein
VSLEADFNRLDRQGRLILSGMAAHNATDFTSLRGASVTLSDGEEEVVGRIVRDPSLGWVAQVDWATQRERSASSDPRTIDPATLAGSPHASWAVRARNLLRTVPTGAPLGSGVTGSSTLTVVSTLA